LSDLEETQHESFQLPSNKDILIWRYMDLAKYLSMLNSRARRAKAIIAEGMVIVTQLEEEQLSYFSDLARWQRQSSWCAHQGQSECKDRGRQVRVARP
jgi:hypothetical protein